MIESIINSLGGETKIKTAIKNNLKWLDKSFLVNNYKGSSAYANVLGKWSSAYPETTGYLLPTLMNVANQLQEDKWSTIAIDQLNYFEDIQNKEGWFFGKDEKVSKVFDNSQILLGISFMANIGIKRPPKLNILNCYNALIDTLDDKGNFISNNFVDEYNPSYYARIVWALLEVEKFFGLETNKKLIRLYERITQLQNDNLSFNDCAFGPGEKNFTHTILYTIRGLWESARLLQDNNVEVKMKTTVRALDEQIKKNQNRFAGAYDTDWKGDTSFCCSVGHCQLALLKLLMYRQSDDENILLHVDELLIPIMNSQRRFGINSGAIPSSIPIYGSYQRFKYTNWTQKFYLDSLIELLQLNFAKA